MRALLRGSYLLLDNHVVKRLPRRVQLGIKASLLAAGRKLFPTLIPPFLTAEHLLLPPQSKLHRPSLPDWARQEMAGLAQAVDANLHPTRFFKARPVIFSAPLNRTVPGSIYFRLLEQINGPVDAVLLVPWIKHGGADLGILHHAKALTEEFGARTLVIATEPSPSPWAARLPPDVQFLEAGQALSSLWRSTEDAAAVLARILIQLAPQTVHIIQSRLGWEALARHGLAIRQQSKVFASLYCNDFDQHGCDVGYASEYLPRTYQWLDAVITDNSASPKHWTRSLGVDERLFHVVPFPAPAVQQRPTRDPQAPKRLLWASRLERQKRPDLIAGLARLLPDFHWDVHGASSTSTQGLDLRELRSAPNITLHGVYDHFRDIVRPDHVAFVYTSEWDGLPNVLLEAAAHGLPIVAADIGGLRDFVPSDQLAAHGDLAGLTSRIRALADTPGLGEECISRQNLGLARRSWQGFVTELRSIRGYGDARRQPADFMSTEGIFSTGAQPGRTA